MTPDPLADQLALALAATTRYRHRLDATADGCKHIEKLRKVS